MSLKETALALAKGHRLGVALFFLLLPSFAVAPARAELAIDGEVDRLPHAYVGQRSARRIDADVDEDHSEHRDDE